MELRKKTENQEIERGKRIAPNSLELDLINSQKSRSISQFFPSQEKGIGSKDKKMGNQEIDRGKGIELNLILVMEKVKNRLLILDDRRRGN
jgi:hypothetical protein